MSWVRCRVLGQVELALAPVMKYSLHDDMVLISLCLYIFFICCYVMVSYVLLSVIVTVYVSLYKSAGEGSYNYGY